jgi:hypothetical protein
MTLCHPTGTSLWSKQNPDRSLLAVDPPSAPTAIRASLIKDTAGWMVAGIQFLVGT